MSIDMAEYARSILFYESLPGKAPDMQKALESLKKADRLDIWEGVKKDVIATIRECPRAAGTVL